VEILLKSARPLQGKRILELYAGMGNFSLPLTQEGAELSGLDENPYAIQDAIQNATHNKISGCRFQIADLNLGIKKYITPRETVDLFLLDPPREGLPKHLLREMIALSPPWILYISCSPPTLARDLKQLTRQGYALNSIQPIDLFPQTAHMEAIAELNYKG
jgi:23S rRNA (uracil1939-C5)-methyltransferase